MKEQIIQFLKNLGLMSGLLPVLTEIMSKRSREENQGIHERQ